MGGGWGLSLRLGDLDEPQARAVRDLVEDYRTFRELLPGAQIYHLAPPLAVPAGATTGPLVEDWFALQYVQPDVGRGAILAVRNGGERDGVAVRLRGLSPDRPYRVAWSDGRPVAEDLGAALMQGGLTLELPAVQRGPAVGQPHRLSCPTSVLSSQRTRRRRVASGSGRPKNVLLLWSDQQRPDTIGAYGNDRIHTPSLDGLARGGALFEQAYCTQPVCTPSRASALTGLYPHTHGHAAAMWC